MTTEEQISKMKKAIVQAIEVTGDRFGSTEQGVARAIQELKASMQMASDLSLSVKSGPGQAASHLRICRSPSGRNRVCNWKEHEQ